MMGNIVPVAQPGPLPATALVTGGAGALGLEIARAIAPGRRVALIDVDPQVNEVAATLPDAIAMTCDLSDSEALSDIYREVFDAWVAGNGSFSINEALVPRLPYTMGGKHELDNFYLSDLASFYRDTGAIWGKHLAK